jgi:hypothetical protein
MNGISHHTAVAGESSSANVAPSTEGIIEAGNENALTAWKYIEPFERASVMFMYVLS